MTEAESKEYEDLVEIMKSLNSRDDVPIEVWSLSEYKVLKERMFELLMIKYGVQTVRV